MHIGRKAALRSMVRNFLVIFIAQTDLDRELDEYHKKAAEVKTTAAV